MIDSEFKQNLQEIADKENDLEQQREQLHSKGVRTIQEIVDRLGIRPEEIRWPSLRSTLESRVRRARSSVKPKYRGPDGELWSGRGRKPRWVVTIMEKGETLDSYRISYPNKES